MNYMVADKMFPWNDDGLKEAEDWAVNLAQSEDKDVPIWSCRRIVAIATRCGGLQSI